MTSDTNDTQEIERIKKRLAREKKARQQAEILLEEKSQELYKINTNLHEHMRLLEATVINAKDAIIITDADLDNGPNIIYVNNAFCKLSGYTIEEIMGKTPRILQGHATDRNVLNDLKEKLSNGKSFQGELKNFSKYGAEYWLDINITPVKNDEGTITHFTSIERDITERKAKEAELKHQMKRAKTANVSKSEFLANMSHELRTPMNGIIGLSDLLMDTPLNEEQEQSIEAINKSSETLLIILNDILDFSKIEAGEMTFENIPFNLKAVIDDTIKLLKSQIESKNIEFKYHYSSSLPAGLVGDSTRLQQIIINLIGNALKFTEKGEIALTLSRTEDNMLKILVDDTGIGIPKNKLNDIFMKFTQADETTSRRFGGTGLGLSISQKLTELMGGTIGVHSIEGQGSSFWFKIPIVEADIDVSKMSTNTQNLTPVDFSNANIMIVDDHPINLMYMRKLLKKIGIDRVQMVDNGQEAFEYTQVGMYDAILMDCQMPGMDGFETTEAIRKMHKGNTLHTPIIAVTANAMKGDREKCIAAGMDDYLSKPVDPNALQQTLQKWVSYNEINKDGDIESVDDLVTEIKPVEDIASPKSDTKPPVDLPALRELFGDDPDDEKMLFDLFFTTSYETIENLQDAINNDDNEQWRKAAHKIKGSAANMRAEKLATICTKAEGGYQATAQIKNNFLDAIRNEIKKINMQLS
jgi:PAS domain S-box-containing protein